MSDKNQTQLEEQWHLRHHEELEHHLYAAKVAANKAKAAKMDAEAKAKQALEERAAALGDPDAAAVFAFLENEARGRSRLPRKSQP